MHHTLSSHRLYCGIASFLFVMTIAACGGGGGGGAPAPTLTPTPTPTTPTPTTPTTLPASTRVNIQISVAGTSRLQGTVSGGGSVTSGQVVTLAARPNPGFVFVRWTENGREVSTNPQYTLTASTNKNLVAHFMHDVNGIWLGDLSPTDDSNSLGVAALLYNGKFIYTEIHEVNPTAFYYSGTYSITESGGTLRMEVQGARLYQSGTANDTANFTGTLSKGKNSMSGSYTTSFGDSGTLDLAFADLWLAQFSSIDRLAGSHLFSSAPIGGLTEMAGFISLLTDAPAQPVN